MTETEKNEMLDELTRKLRRDPHEIIEELNNDLDEMKDLFHQQVRKDREKIEKAFIDGYYHACNQKWIPASKQLPEESGYFLVTIKGFGENDADFVSIRRYNHGYGFDQNVTAWMPVPEAYKGD